MPIVVMDLDDKMSRSGSARSGRQMKRWNREQDRPVDASKSSRLDRAIITHALLAAQSSDEIDFKILRLPEDLGG
jgi:hypothetical protein